ncbi:MAG: glutaredoxin family protein [Gammaproteobacteria bacterium]
MVRGLLILLLLGAGYAWQHEDELRLAWRRAQPDYQPPQVTLFATSWCGYCREMRAFFAAEKIAYTELDIEASAPGRVWHEQLGGKGVPVTLVGEAVVHGYDPEGVRAALASQ